jgi:hypothetical protein
MLLLLLINDAAPHRQLTPRAVHAAGRRLGFVAGSDQCGDQLTAAAPSHDPRSRRCAMFDPATLRSQSCLLGLSLVLVPVPRHRSRPRCVTPYADQHRSTPSPLQLRIRRKRWAWALLIRTGACLLRATRPPKKPDRPTLRSKANRQQWQAHQEPTRRAPRRYEQTRNTRQNSPSGTYGALESCAVMSLGKILTAWMQQNARTSCAPSRSRLVSRQTPGQMACFAEFAI